MVKRNPPREEAQVLIEALEAGPYYDLPYIQKWMARVGLAENDNEVRKLLKELERFMDVLTANEALAEEAKQEASIEDINQALLMGTLGIAESGRVTPLRVSAAPARRGRAVIEPGTISHGTLSPENLIPAFFYELQRVSPAAAGGFQADVEIYERAIERDEQPEDDMELVVSLQDALDAAAPPGLRFGAHEGDGSDFGWWPVEEEGGPPALVTPTADSEAVERAFEPGRQLEADLESLVNAIIEVKGFPQQGWQAAVNHHIMIDDVIGPFGQNTRFRAHGRGVDFVSWFSEGPHEAPFPPGSLIHYSTHGRYVSTDPLLSRTIPFTLDTFTRSYINTALWASVDESDETGGRPLDERYSREDIDRETLKEMKQDCERFQEENAEELRSSNLDEEKAGHDFWLTRNRHGAGFWDEGLGPVGERLTEAAHALGGYHLYVGDDGKVHGERG